MIVKLQRLNCWKSNILIIQLSKCFNKEAKFHINVAEEPGSGAEGGLGAALHLLTGAKLKPGINTLVLDCYVKKKTYR